MTWILLASLGQFLHAIVAIIDKYIVSDDQALPKPFVYAFYSCLVAGFWLLLYLVGLLPFINELGLPSYRGIEMPTLTVIALAFLAAYTFFIALVSMYDALKHADASNVMPIIGSVAAFATFGMSYLFLDAELAPNFISGVIILATGTLLVAQTLPRMNVVLHVIHAGLFFALHAVTMKGLFLETTFDNGFFWSRVGLVLFALSLLLVPSYVHKITAQTKTTTKKAGLIVLGAKVMAGVAAFMILRAMDMGDVAVVQALDALKFMFILVISMLFAHWLPDSATDRDTRPATVFRRLLYVVVIAVGFFMFFA